MKIAVTYENGEVFQHFGRTQNFKIYDVEDNRVVSTLVTDSEGQGHGALAGVLANKEIDLLICGGIGEGAREALADAGIQVVAGAEGKADDAVAEYLAGTLKGSDENCDHHHEDGEGCGHHEDGEGCCSDDGVCGDGCDQSSCGGCCGRMNPVEGKNAGKKCTVHYRGTFNDGTQFDSSYDRGEPLEFVCGAGMMIKGFDSAVANMEVGETIDVHLMPSEAYGESDPRAIFRVDIAQMPGAESVSVGQKAYLQNQYGQPIPVKVVAKDEKTVTFDANHEMAGKELNFRIELVEVR